MKSISYLLVLGVVVSLVSCTQQDPGMDLGALHLSKAYPKPGDSLDLHYHTDKEVEESYFIYTVKNKVYPADLELSKTGDEWNGKLFIPDSASSLAIQIKSDGEFDSNNKAGFYTPLYSEENKPLPGSIAGTVLYVNRYAPGQKIEVETDSLISKLATEFEMHPELKKDFFVTYAQMLFKKDEEEAKKVVTEKIAEMTAEPDLSYEDYEAITSLYSTIRLRDKYDSISKIAAEKYPDSRMAQVSAYRTFYAIKDRDEKIAFLNEFLGKTPESEYGDYMLSALAQTYAQEKDYENYKKYMDLISNQGNVVGGYNNIAWNLAEKGEDLEIAGELSKKSLDILKSKQEDLEGNKPDYYSLSQYERSLNSQYQMYADTYGLILFKQGKLKEALEIQEIAAGEYSSAEVKERYIEFLVANEEYEKAKEKASEFIADNKSTAKMKEYLEEAYTENPDIDNDFATYLSALEEKAHAKMLAEIEKKLLNEEASDFKLVSIEGEEVALNALKGKTVILDFWATWCGPCKASFPGMQMAVEKYKDNPDVVFLFIDTWETGTDESRIELTGDFISKNNYDFTVLLDTPKEEGSDQFVVVSDYEVSGIPTKFVIGPDGKVKFKSVGFGGSAEKLVDELSIMIELAKS